MLKRDRSIRAVGFYALSVVMFILFILMNQSERLKDAQVIADRVGSDSGFKMFAIINLSKYTLLVGSIAVFMTTSLMVLLDRKK